MPQATHEEIVLQIFNLVNMLNTEVLASQLALKNDEKLTVFKITGIFMALSHVSITDKQALEFHRGYVSEFNKLPDVKRTAYFRNLIKSIFIRILSILTQSLPFYGLTDYSNLSALEKAEDLYDHRIFFLIMAKEQAPNKSGIELHQIFRQIAESRYNISIAELLQYQKVDEVLFKSQLIREIFPEEAAFFDYKFEEIEYISDTDDFLKNLAHCVARSAKIRLQLITRNYPYRPKLYKSFDHYNFECHRLLIKQLNEALLESFNRTLANLYNNHAALAILKEKSEIFKDSAFSILLQSECEQPTKHSAASAASSSSSAASSSQFTTFSPKQEAYKQTADDQAHQEQQQLYNLRNVLPELVDLYREIYEKYDGDMKKAFKAEKVIAVKNNKPKKTGALSDLEMIWTHNDPELKEALIELASAAHLRK